jgi:predicted MPP superfamily phosphohydrolase
MRKRIIIRALLGLLLIAFIAGFAVGWWFRVREIAIPLGLPRPVTLAVMSDTHLGSYDSAETAQRAVREVMKRRPDAILLLGDYVSNREAISSIPSVLAGLRAPLGVYAVLGNHDHWADAGAVRAALASAGIQVLLNRSVVIRKGRTRLALVGIDDLWTGKVNWKSAWRRVPKGVPVVLLSHNPDAALHPEGERAALIVSGHTHGGKILLPQWVLRVLRKYTDISPVPATRYGERHLYGLMREKWGWVYITSGTVTGFSPPRWYTRPEVAILRLR